MAQATGPFRPLDVEIVRDMVFNTRFATVVYTAQTGSTNDDAYKVMGDPRLRGATFVADEQTAGKGRKAGRRWIAPPGTALLFTSILPLTVSTGELWVVPFWAALAVADGIRRSCGTTIDLRWPNDLFVRDKKVGGILCISRISGGTAHVGVGVGINVARPAGYGASGIEPPPGYLSDVVRRLSREVILAEILIAFNRRLPSLRSAATIATTYAERAGLIGARYRVRMDIDGALFEGIARGLGPDGALRLDVNGTERLIALADARRV